MRSDAATVAEYLDGLPAERRAAIGAVLALVRASMPDGYVEALSWGMIAWEVPLELSGTTYNGRPLMYAALASQKHHMALYLCGVNCVPGLEARLREAYAVAGKKLDLGKACLRFRRLEQVEPEVLAEVISAVPPERFVEASRRAHRR